MNSKVSGGRATRRFTRAAAVAFSSSRGERRRANDCLDDAKIAISKPDFKQVTVRG
jgi:hypothetical protein